MVPVPDPDVRSDETLLAGINAGDESAFESLYHRYRDWTVRLAYRFCGNETDSLDVLQETFGYLLRRAPHLHLSARMTTFLYPVVKNLALAARRKRIRGQGDAVLEDLPARMDTADLGVRAELAAVLACLPAAQREVLLMRFVDDMSLEEIGGALGIPVGTVKSRLHNALQVLRQDPGTRAYFERE